MKKWFLLIIVLLLTAGMLFAGGGKEKDAGGAEETTSGQSEAAEDTGGLSGTVNVLTFQYIEDSVAKKAIDRILEGFYAEHPNVEVEFVNTPHSEYENRLKIAFASGDPSDIVWMDAPNIASYAEEGVLEPLDSYWDKADFNDLVPSAQNGMKYNGKIWAAPLNEANICVWYNKDLTNAAGINPPESLDDAWTWKEFYEAAKKLTKKDSSGKVTVYGVMPAMGAPVAVHEGITFTVVQWIWQAGGEILSNGGKTAMGVFNSKEGVNALAYYQRFFEEEISPKQDIPNGFETGKIAMYVTGPWQLGYMQSSHPDFNLGTTPLPIGETGASPTGSWNLGITAKSKNKDAAWAFIQALTGKEGSFTWSETTKDVPARKSTFQKSTVYTENSLLNPIKEQLMLNGKPRPVTPVYPKISEYISKAFNDAAFGQDPKSTADKYAKMMQDALDDYFGK